MLPLVDDSGSPRLPAGRARARLCRRGVAGERVAVRARARLACDGVSISRPRLRTSQTTTPTKSARRLGRLLVACQVALSVLLLIGAGLFVQTLRNLNRLDLGFDPGQLLQVSVDTRSSGYGKGQVAAALSPAARARRSDSRRPVGDGHSKSSDGRRCQPRIHDDSRRRARSQRIVGRGGHRSRRSSKRWESPCCGDARSLTRTSRGNSAPS